MVRPLRWFNLLRYPHLLRYPSLSYVKKRNSSHEIKLKKKIKTAHVCTSSHLQGPRAPSPNSIALDLVALSPSLTSSCLWQLRAAARCSGRVRGVRPVTAHGARQHLHPVIAQHRPRDFPLDLEAFRDWVHSPACFGLIWIEDVQPPNKFLFLLSQIFLMSRIIYFISHTGEFGDGELKIRGGSHTGEFVRFRERDREFRD